MKLPFVVSCTEACSHGFLARVYAVHSQLRWGYPLKNNTQSPKIQINYSVILVPVPEEWKKYIITASYANITDQRKLSFLACFFKSARMDPALLRERELFKKRALSTPAVEKRQASSDSGSHKKKKPKVDRESSSGSKHSAGKSSVFHGLSAVYCCY